MRHRLTQAAAFCAGLALLLGLAACGPPAAEEEASRWLSLEIERPETVPAPTDPVVPPAPPAPDEDGMLLATFPVPRSFMLPPVGARTSPESSASRRARIDPPKVRTAQERLESFGISFPPGTFARYDPASSTFVVRQTPELMELVEGLLYFYHTPPGRTVFLQIEIYEVPEAHAVRLLRNADGHLDHAPEHETVGTLLRQGEARLVQSTRILSRNGQRSGHKDGYEVVYSVPLGGEDSEFGGPSSRRRGREVTTTVGTWLEVDPVVSADETAIDLSLTLEFHSADPTWHEIPPGSTSTSAGIRASGLHPRFRRHSCKLKSTFGSGEPRLIASWRPQGERTDHDGETLLLVFLTPTVGFPLSPPPQ